MVVRTDKSMTVRSDKPGVVRTGKSRRPPPSLLSELAALYGIERSYRDVFKRRRTASEESLLATLRALGAAVKEPADVGAALRERRRQLMDRLMEPVTVAWEGKLSSVAIRLKSKQARGGARLRLTLESGEERRWNVRLGELVPRNAIVLGRRRYEEKMIPLKQRLPLGYHQLAMECGSARFETLVIAAPRRAYEEAGKLWGAFLPLHALHTHESWGAGDFTDLRRLREWIGGMGGDFVGTLPFLAAFLKEPKESNLPFEPSPYMPASRLFWNELYIDPRQAPEFEGCKAAQRVAESAAFGRQIGKAREAGLVDYGAEMERKRRVLEAMAAGLKKNAPERWQAFEKYRAEHPRLSDYARFRAVGERQQKGWLAWPRRMRNGTIGVGDYDPEAARYHEYVQWLAEEQLAGAGVGKSIGEAGITGGEGSNGGDGSGAGNKAKVAGLYLDFPLGVHPESYDVWRERGSFALEASAGAPPDTFFTGGQNWTFPPMAPEAMREDGYGYLRECLRHQMRHARMLRIDHVMGLHRLYWIPKEMDATEGVYVKYRPEEMYAIVNLESQRARATVVGENLGTVPAEVTREMKKRGILGMYVLQYEILASGSKGFSGPGPEAKTVASLNTHDMSPYHGFFRDLDLEDFLDLGLFSAKETARGIETRRKAWQALASFVGVRAGAGPPGAKPTEETLRRVLEKALEWLGGSRARACVVNLEDLWLETRPQNIPGTGPGTGLERANWRRKARYSLEEMERMKEALRALRKLNRARAGH